MGWEMAKQVGIRQNCKQIFISGARVAFDPRITAEVADTRDMTNYKTLEQPRRKRAWEDRQREAQQEAAE